MPSVSAYESPEDRAVVIKVNGNFAPIIHDEFQAVYSRTPPESRFIVDLSETEAFESASLSLLLELRNYAGGPQANIDIVNCPEQAKQLLELMNFDQLFNMP